LDIEADQIVIHMRTENVEASGEVRLIMRSGESGTPVGFFSGGKPVFITCGRMNTRADDRRFFFRDQVRIWQERESVSASELDILQETGRVVFRGGVHSLLFRKTGDDDDEEERLEMRSDEMVFIPERNLIRYTGSGRLETQSFTLRADSLAVTLAGTGGGMDRVEAEGNVVIDQEARQGRGERAVYERAEATVVLTGHPVLAERDKGETKGDKLTFYLDDGRIAIENIKRDRSTTVIIR
jgi:lipopolysaccharide transport protein LptA